MKLTTIEKRAKALCETLLTYDGGEINMEWRKSSMYGFNPAILFRGEKCCNISGCGYDKKSAALADVLRFLFPIGSDEYNSIHSTSGCGVSSVQDRLLKAGWQLEHTANGNTFDGFRLTRLVLATKGGN